MSGCKPSTYRSIVFLNSWICRNDSDSMSVSSRDSIWGSMLTFAYCLFSTWCWKNTGILWVHPNLVGNMAVYICGQIWVPDHDSQFAPLRTEIPLLETVGGCPNPVLSKDLNNPSQSKTKIRNSTKKTSVTGKTDRENCPYGFPCIIIFNMSISPSKVNLTGRSSLWPRLRGRRWAAPPHLCWPSAAGVASHGPGLRRAAAVSWSHGTWEVNLGRFSLTIIGGYGDNDEQIELNNMG